ncbi:MAG: N-methyl-L-tryptophan oxidase [Thermomicrobiales bacterium]
MTDTYDVIVVGLGAAGSPTAYRLAQRGQRVLGLEMFEPGHPWGSSHGQHRMIRKSAIQGSGYDPLAERAFELWDELEDETGQQFLTMTGEVRLIAEGRDPRYKANAAEMEQRGAWEILDETELAKRFPGFRLHEGMIATYEAGAGFLWSERGIIAHVELARKHGAVIHTSEEVTGWEADGEGVTVTTDRNTYRAGKLVMTTGAYVGELLADLELPFQVNRSINGYFEPSRPDWWRAENGAPDFILDVPEGGFYGMPAIGDIGLKIGLSTQDKTGPRTIRRTIEPEEIQYLRDTLDKYMPGAAGKDLKALTCMDAYTVDDHFIIDRHPEHPQVILGCCFSGRGYKFSPVLGEILADLAIDGETGHDIEFLSLERFS